MFRYSEMGTVVIGKVESGKCKKGDLLLVMPNRVEVKVDQLWSDDIEVTKVQSGENIKAKVGWTIVLGDGIEVTKVQSGENIKAKVGCTIVLGDDVGT